MAPSSANKSDNFDCENDSTREPHLSGTGEFMLSLVSYGYGMGDSSDDTAVSSFEEEDEAVDEPFDVSNAVTTGCFNVGKLLSPNCTSGVDCLTALNTVGMMCDVTDIAAECNGKYHCTADIVGTCKKSIAHENTEHHLTACGSCVTDCVDAVSSAADVLAGAIE